MTESAASRRMRMLEELAHRDMACDVGELARDYHVDERTVRRDIDHLQNLFGRIQGVSLRRGRVHTSQESYGSGYFTDQLRQNEPAKLAIARHIVDILEDNLAITLTAGSTTFHIAREIRRAYIEEERPRNLIAFTNSLPALLELIAAGVTTGVIGEVYNADDCAFHAHEFHTAFQASVAIVGASGVVTNPAAGTLDLFSHRAEEAAFLKQLLGPIPEIVVAVDNVKLGHRHPWSFTAGGVLSGKNVRLITNALSADQRSALDRLSANTHRSGFTFQYADATGGQRT